MTKGIKDRDEGLKGMEIREGIKGKEGLRNREDDLSSRKDLESRQNGLKDRKQGSMTRGWSQMHKEFSKCQVVGPQIHVGEPQGQGRRVLQRQRGWPKREAEYIKDREKGLLGGNETSLKCLEREGIKHTERYSMASKAGRRASKAKRIAS